jgi:regulator of replication initiation timing
MPKREPTSAEYQFLLDENDALRRDNVRLRTELKNKDQTIDHLELKDRARMKRMGDKDEEIYQLGVANRDLETENRNLKFDNTQLLERLTKQQQSIIDRLQPTGHSDILGDALERARMKKVSDSPAIKSQPASSPPSP